MSQSTTSGGGPGDPAAAFEGQDLSAGAAAGADGGAQVDQRALRVGAAAAGAAQVERQAEAADLGLGVGDVGGAHRLEIHALQALAVRHRVMRLDLLALLRRGRGRVARGLQGLGEAAAAGGGLGAGGLGLGVEQVHRGGHASGLWVAPEDRKSVVEQLLVVVAVDHGGAERAADLGAAAELDAGHRLLGGQHVGRADRQAGAAEQAGEVQDVGGQLALGGGHVADTRPWLAGGIGEGRPGRCPGPAGAVRPQTPIRSGIVMKSACEGMGQTRASFGGGARGDDAVAAGTGWWVGATAARPVRRAKRSGLRRRCAGTSGRADAVAIAGFAAGGSPSGVRVGAMLARASRMRWRSAAARAAGSGSFRPRRLARGRHSASRRRIMLSISRMRVSRAVGTIGRI